MVLAVFSFPRVLLPYDGHGLDPSWTIGLDEAAQRRFVFGRDVGFTYGPLGPVFYPMCKGDALPASLPVIGLLYAAHLCSLALVASLIPRGGKLGAFAVGMMAFGLAGHYGGLAGMLVANCGFLVPAHLSGRTLLANPAVVLCAAALLTKINIGVACVGSTLAYLALGVWRVRPAQAVKQGGLLLGVLVGAFILLFRVTNGPIQVMGDYLQTSCSKYFWRSRNMGDNSTRWRGVKAVNQSRASSPVGNLTASVLLS